MQLDELNNLPSTIAFAELQKCCGATRWVSQMTGRRPFQNTEELFRAADEIWKSLAPKDWKEAFAHHPKIGDARALRDKFSATAAWAKGEQSGVTEASEEILRELAEGNKQYEEKFGYIFIVCATGTSAGELLSVLQQRLNNDPTSELIVAAEEQRKITRLRLEKLLG